VAQPAGRLLLPHPLEHLEALVGRQPFAEADDVGLDRLGDRWFEFNHFVV
jgi:hypothetical protein